jgi:hypothetical protein
MDDNNPLGVTQISDKEYAWHQEQARRAFDIIRVKNPTNEDYVIEWGRPATFHRVPANSTADLFRYLAVYYVRHMKDKIINEANQKRHDQYMAERRAKGYPQYKSKYEENEETYLTPEYTSTGSVAAALPLYSQLWVGLVSEYGKDQVPQVSDLVDLTQDEVILLKSVQDRKVTETAAKPVTPESPIKPEATVKPKAAAKPVEALDKDQFLAEVSEQ